MAESHKLQTPDEGSNLVQYIEDFDLTNATVDRWKQLLDILSSPSESDDISDKKLAAKEVRVLTREVPRFRLLIHGCVKRKVDADPAMDPICRLLKPLAEGEVDTHPDLQEDLITTLFNLSIPRVNGRFVGENERAMPLLVRSLVHGNITTKTNAAATLFSLSSMDYNKKIIGKAGALPHLIVLLGEEDIWVVKDAAQAIFRLCYIQENRKRAVESGVVPVLLRKIMADVLINELLSTLVLIVNNYPTAVKEMQQVPGAVAGLFRIIQMNQDHVVKENCVVILHRMCLGDSTFIWEIRREETASNALAYLAKNGNLIAFEKASVILQYISKGKAKAHPKP